MEKIHSIFVISAYVLITLFHSAGCASAREYRVQSTDTISPPTIKKIKAQTFYPFKEGLAIISYGQANALIDKDGNFVVPYNTYDMVDFRLGTLEPEHGFVNGTCVVRDKKTWRLGVIDTKGKLIIPTEYILAYPFDDDGWCRVMDQDKKDFFINKKGVKIPVKPFFFGARTSFISPDGGIDDLFMGGIAGERAKSGIKYIGDFHEGISMGRAGNLSSYFDRFGKQMIADTFHHAGRFSEGLACVVKPNEFGEHKYGFINTKGEQVIPFMFTRIPGDFHDGMAYIEPAGFTEFRFAFINREGAVILKQTEGYPYESPRFEDGYFQIQIESGIRTAIKIIDINGQEVNAIKNLRGKIFCDCNYKNGILTFKYKDVKKSNGQAAGFVNLKTGRVVYTDYYYVGLFDKTSGLAVADNKYIRQDGKVVMEMEKSSEW